MYIWHNASLSLKQDVMATRSSCFAMPMTLANDCYGITSNICKLATCLNRDPCWDQLDKCLEKKILHLCEFFSNHRCPMANNNSVFSRLTAPLTGLFQSNANARKCTVSDLEWSLLGIRRVLLADASGRAFLQGIEYQDTPDMATGHFFEALKSPRRLLYTEELNNALINSKEAWNDIDDPLADYHELDDFDINSGDGHYHKAPIHEKKVDGTAYETQHFYGINMRSQMTFHLATALYGEGRKKENDIHALKRLYDEKLRQGSKKGRKVLWVWDRAGMDMRQWYLWKRKGIYFLTREKSLNKPIILGEPEFDQEDPVNAGVIKNELFGSTSGVEAMRRITYEVPETGEVYVYLTNLPQSIRPGVIAYLYKRRWDIEKMFNTFKHKFFERRAWAVSETAKSMQANFICLAHNLMLIFHRVLAKEIVEEFDYDIDKTHKKRKKKRIEKLSKNCEERKKTPSSLIQQVVRLAELPVVFIRWLRGHISYAGSWEDARDSLLVSCARFLS